MPRNYGSKDANMDSPSNRSFDRSNLDKMQTSDKFGMVCGKSGSGSKLIVSN